MAYSIPTRGPVDGSRIELNEDYELGYWTSRFGCTAEQLVDALQAVGVSATAVGRYLGAQAAGAQVRHDQPAVTHPPST